MPMPEILEITDGTDTVSFLNEGSGFILKEWEPKIAQAKDGGVWKDSGIADGRQLAMIRYANVDEEFILAVTGENQNALYRNMRKLRALLLKAQTYWLSGYAYEPVWLKVKGKNEVYPRYSVIAGWNYEAESNPFHPPVGGPVINSTMDDWSLFVERRPTWRDTAPGIDVDIKAGVAYSYGGRTFGNVDAAGALDPTIAAESFIANKHQFINLTHVFEDDGAVFSANLLDAAVPHRLLPAVPAIGDNMYFGIAIDDPEASMFSNLIFDIVTGAVGVTGQWEYWNGAWVVFPVIAGWNSMSDNTDGFSNTGVLGAFWDYPDDWASNAINGVYAWWVRFNVTGIAGPTGGSQQNRKIYFCSWPYVEIQNDQIEGELPALLQTTIRNQSNYDDDFLNQKYTDWLMCGIRGVDRGNDFSAYLPVADIQHVPGQTVTLSANASYVDREVSARGRCVELAPGAPAGGGTFYVTLDNTIASQYKGRFHMFIRYHGGSGSNEWTLSVRIRAYGNIWESDVVNVDSRIDPSLLDMGSVNLPPAGFGDNETVEEIEFFITANRTAGASVVRIFEIILMPADEWLGQFYGGYTYGPRLWSDNYLVIDSVTFPKKLVYCPVRTRAADYLQSQYTNVNVGPFRIEGERRTRLWFLAQTTYLAAYRTANHTYAHDTRLAIARQYLSAIGENI